MIKELRAIRNRFSYIYLVSLATFLLQVPFFSGEDIVNARENFLSGSRIDFWGGTSTLVYGNFPSFGLRWQIGLALLQISITTLGLVLLFGPGSRITENKGLNFLGVYLALMFGSQMTRDGLMFSLLVLGFALLIKGSREEFPLPIFFISFLLIIWSLSFRPWVSAAVLPLLFMLLNGVKIKKSKVFTLSLAVSIIVLPILSEVVISKSLELKKSFPEQMVMLTDVASAYCYTNNYKTGVEVKEALDIFSESGDISSNACNFFRPDTWISLTQARTASSEGLASNFSLIQPEDLAKYQKLRSIWFRSIITDPVTYIQNRILFIGKLVVGSDTRKISFFSGNSIFDKLSSTFKAPYELAITLHLFSVAAVTFFILLTSLVRLRRNMPPSLSVQELSLTLLASMLIWTILSSVAYVGSNGRYTYSITILSILLLANSKSRKFPPAIQHDL